MWPLKEGAKALVATKKKTFWRLPQELGPNFGCENNSFKGGHNHPPPYPIRTNVKV